jgi:glucose/arabinose dehydrogenase
VPGRRPRARPVRRLAAVVATCLLASYAASCSSGDGDDPATTTTEAAPRDDRFTDTGFVPADQPAALAVAPDGSLLIGELDSGRILRVASDQLDRDRPEATEYARLDVATDGQQGLVGLVGLDDGIVLAGLSQRVGDEVLQRIVQVVPGGDPVAVWDGPVAADQAVGGRLAVAADGRVLIGLGDFLEGSADSFGPDEPYSKLLSVDPAGPADQTPQVVSSGWNNPFAFTVGPDGAIWVADNSPGEVPERIARGDREGPSVDLSGQRAPSGVVVLGTDELAVCGYLSGQLELVPLREGVPGEPTAVLSESCTLGVLALGGGRLAVAAEDGVHLLAPG